MARHPDVRDARGRNKAANLEATVVHAESAWNDLLRRTQTPQSHSAQSAQKSGKRVGLRNAAARSWKQPTKSDKPAAPEEKHEETRSKLKPQVAEPQAAAQTPLTLFCYPRQAPPLAAEPRAAPEDEREKP